MDEERHHTPGEDGSWRNQAMEAAEWRSDGLEFRGMGAIICASGMESASDDDDNDDDGDNDDEDSMVAVVERLPAARTCRKRLTLPDGLQGAQPIQSSTRPRQQLRFVGLPGDGGPAPTTPLNLRPVRLTEHVGGDAGLPSTHRPQPPMSEPVLIRQSQGDGSSSHNLQYGGQQYVSSMETTIYAVRPPHLRHASVSDYTEGSPCLQQLSFSRSRTAGELPSSPLKPSLLSYARTPSSHSGAAAPGALQASSYSPASQGLMYPSFQAQGPSSSGRTSNSPMASRTMPRCGSRTVGLSSTGDLLDATTRSLLPFAIAPRSPLKKDDTGGIGSGTLSRGGSGCGTLSRRVEGEKKPDILTHLFSVMARAPSSSPAVKRSASNVSERFARSSLPG